MKISIAMTTYNGERYLEKQLDSLLNQTRRADEVVIRDDCSTDKTALIIQTFIKENEIQNWDFAINKKNLGYKRNFYEAISQTTGEIIFLCDQDDIWLSDKLEKMEKIFKINEKVLCLNTSFNFINPEDEKIAFKQKRGKINNNLFSGVAKEQTLFKVSVSEILKTNISPGCTCAFHEKIKKIYMKQTDRCLPHDWEINIYGALLDGLFFYNEALINYRIHDNNQIGLKTDRRLVFKMTGDYTNRMKVLEEQQGLVNLCETTWVNEKLSKTEQKRILLFASYIEYRRLCLTKLNAINFFKLSIVYFRIRKSFSVAFRSLLGDFRYMVSVNKRGINNEQL